MADGGRRHLDRWRARGLWLLIVGAFLGAPAGRTWLAEIAAP